ncbi:putative bifunctional diguanylate cyclase/phosphodiesterase [Candidatus Marinarcus aquaticus]|uniref:GGDEF-domain containing protein n=1 Tax=Candidatus Marinarcus aquaticus TaxID=2044504 RepID=A0A4V1LP47_9BACT|nr:bifunctional diguanylate cyclase/phosphodiesterase [Candidatus Marinarcus aquaticus]RXJ59938.1 GGDEF-domain containing protein [Candidatus Marinarcus aquaticus]
MKTRFFIKNPIYLILLTLSIATILILLLFGTFKLEDKIEDKMFEISTLDVISITQNSANNIENLLNPEKDYISQIQKDMPLRHHIEKNLELLLTKNIKYAYVIYRDKKGTFRFLADGSDPSDKAFVNQKLDVFSPKWNEIYEIKEPLMIRHTFLQELSMSYLVPISQNGQVELILVIDFSIKKIENINQIIEWMKNAILSIIVIIAIFLLVLIIQTIKYTAVKKTAYIDKLTNVYNRNYLHELQEFVNLNDYILAAIDIDHFKKVNDTYGHEVGDKVLKQVANTILLNIRTKDDIVIRYGGEEFLLLIRTTRDDHLSALNVLERIFKNIQENHFHVTKKEYIEVTISVGVNLVPEKSRTFSDAFKLADIALYNAKNKGRNNIEVYDEQGNGNGLTLSINEIKDAMEEQRVICHYQAIVDAKTQEISHYEALLRVRDKEGNILMPYQILPVIKGTFILRNITKTVLKICRKKLLERPDISVNVNLNPQDIINESILKMLIEYAREDQLGSRLGIEIVESEDIINCPDAKENLLMLKNLGYKIFIDDFGSGYSNFIYLTQIKTDYIKIDGEIIKNILTDRVSYLLVKNIVEFSKEANIKVIAEYVSNEEIFSEIQMLGVDYAQGYYFSKPADLV